MSVSSAPRWFPGQARLLELLTTAREFLLPEEQEAQILKSLASAEIVASVKVKGDLLHRTAIVCAQDSTIVASLTGRPLGECIPKSLTGFEVGDPRELVSLASVADSTSRALSRPRISLVVLNHPENFPMPRFALGVAYLAAAVRESFIGEVSIIDMQLDYDKSSLLRKLEAQQPDIIGISITFGQLDLAFEVIDSIRQVGSTGALIALGGSVAALCARKIVEARPEILVCSGPGEAFICDVIDFWLGRIPKRMIRDAVFRSSKKEVIITERSSPREQTLPELDLLPSTLAQDGVFLLEVSRGCTNACTFCPRENKGRWYGLDPGRLKDLMPYVDAAFSSYPQSRRTIFVIDEEFIGTDAVGGGAERVRQVASAFSRHQFRFEANARIDQVCDLSRDLRWHADRVEFWRGLARSGLRKCLFGVESGVDSVLRRFGKRIAVVQNVYAVRTLTRIGLPLRCTYIVFDPLMSMQELLQSFSFLGRTDLILQKRDDDALQLASSARDEGFVSANSSGLPFYSLVPYMLVSLECLISSPYLEEVQAQGLQGNYNFGMGRCECSYVQPIIGLMSHFSQLWIDRNFALDYTLKSLQKVCDDNLSIHLECIRRRIKQAAYELLGDMLFVAGALDAYTRGDMPILKELRSRFAGGVGSDSNSAVFSSLLEASFATLAATVSALLPKLNFGAAAGLEKRLHQQTAAWAAKKGWSLINGVER